MQHIVFWEWCFGEVKVSQLWVSSRPEGGRSWENAMNTTQRASANMVSCDYENKKPHGNSVKSWMGQGFPTDGIKPVLFDLQNRSDLSYYLEIKRKEILELEILPKLRIICRNLCKTEAPCVPLFSFAPWVAIHHFSTFLEESSISQWDKLSFQSFLKLLFFQSHTVLDYSGLLMRESLGSDSGTVWTFNEMRHRDLPRPFWALNEMRLIEGDWVHFPKLLRGQIWLYHPR